MVTLEQEAASVMRYVLEAAGSPAPYYHNVPERFQIPSVFFPTPEVTTGPDTFVSYGADFQWHIKFFARTTEAAYEKGKRALTAIQAGRRLIPLLDADGNKTGERLRVYDPSLKALDDKPAGLGTAQLSIGWRSRRPYDRDAVLMMRKFHLYFHRKSGQLEPEAVAETGSAMAGYYLQG